MRLVKTATLKRAAVDALQHSECEDTSSTAWVQPASAMSRKRCCRSEASGVVRTASTRRSADAVLDGAEEADRAAGRAQHGVDQVGGGGLAVRARDADEVQPLRGMVEDRRREHGQRLPRVLHPEPGSPGAGVRLGDDRHRALLPRRVHERVAVLGEAA